VASQARTLKLVLTAAELACVAGSIVMSLADRPAWPFQVPFAVLFVTHAAILLRERRSP
jgi:hypothetical protein